MVTEVKLQTPTDYNRTAQP